MSRGINREVFTEVGLLLDTDEYGLVIKLTFGKALKKVLRHLFDKKLEITVTELVYNRSSAQNRWLWGVAYETVIAHHRDTTGEKITKFIVKKFYVSSAKCECSRYVLDDCLTFSNIIWNAN
jgi:hypothetical protein